jgi:enterochelin esterase family protein
MFKLRMAILVTALACSSLLAAPPVRKYDDKGAPPFKVLEEGENPPLDAHDNFVIGPKYVPAPERKEVEGVPEGKVEQFVIDSKETKLFNPGIARKEFGKVDPKNPKTLIVETHTIDYKRKITVYIPAQSKPDDDAPVRRHPFFPFSGN